MRKFRVFYEIEFIPMMFGVLHNYLCLYSAVYGVFDIIKEVLHTERTGALNVCKVIFRE